MKHTDDKIGVAPTLSGLHGRAWKIDVAGHSKDFPASVALWMIEAPWCHPFWHSYIISLVDLIPRETDLEPPVLYFEGATHEMAVMAMDPEKPRGQAFTSIAGLCLHPSNFCSQMVSDNANAERKIEATVREVVAGDLSADTDFMHEWVKRFGDSGMKEQYRRPRQ